MTDVTEPTRAETTPPRRHASHRIKAAFWAAPGGEWRKFPGLISVQCRSEGRGTVVEVRSADVTLAEDLRAGMTVRLRLEYRDAYDPGRTTGAVEYANPYTVAEVAPTGHFRHFGELLVVLRWEPDGRG
jgi:hypothetical protein